MKNTHRKHESGSIAHGNAIALEHYLNARQMRHEIYGCDPTSPELKRAIEKELTKQNPKTLKDIIAEVLQATER